MKDYIDYAKQSRRQAMVQHGEDSLVNHEGGKVDDIEANIEPTEEQLRATGELGPEEELSDGVGELSDFEPDTEEGNAKVNGEAPAGSRLPVVQMDKNLSIRKQIENALTSGVSQDELIGAGFNKRSVQTVASELRGKGKVPKTIGRAAANTKGSMPAFAKGTPPEIIIDSMSVPDVANGQGVPFELGMKFGMSVLVLATRIMQEVSIAGAAQTKPLLDIARSMREGEAIAAKNAAGEAAMEAAGMVSEQFKPYFNMISSLTKREQPAITATAKNPMEAMMFNTMQPIIQSILGKAVGQLTGVPVNNVPQLTEGWTRKEE